jgi:alkylation response protein AidB-like acyl-CoA dehydrogenase
MDLRFGEEYEAFRAEVRSFVAEHWDGEVGETGPALRDEEVRFRKRAIERGYLARSVPRKYGGSEQQEDLYRGVIVGQEFGHAGAPQDPRPPVTQLIPTLLEHGTDFQKDAFLPATVTGEMHWCQGYSEPGSGSDLASLSTRAELVGDSWVINGQKIWTSGAQQAEMMYLLCRTEPDAGKHAGISYLLLDMAQPGIEVRPLATLTGETEFSQVFFDDVRTPANHLVGERGGGWLVSRSTLKHERGLAAVAATASGRKEFDELVELANEFRLSGRPAIEDDGIRQRLAEIDGFLTAHETSTWIQLTCAARGEDPGPIATMNKLVSTNIGHLMAKLTIDLLADDALHAPPIGPRGLERIGIRQYLRSLGISVAAGTSNIQRNLIGEHGLGLPRDLAARKRK